MNVAIKHTELGPIPGDWEIMAFGTLFAFTNGLNADKSAYGKGIPFINVLEPITYSHIYGPEIPGRVQISGESAVAFLVKTNDIVLNRTSETDSELGLAAVYLGDRLVVFGGFVIRGRPISDALDPNYSGYALRAKMIRTQIVSMGQGAVRANIGQQNLKRVLVAVPPKHEQMAIAKALGDIDALIAALDRLIAKKHGIKQATMQLLLTGKTRLPGFSGKWETKRLGDMAEIVSGGTPRTNVPSYWNGSVKWCTPTDITRHNGKVLFETDRTISKEGLDNCGARLLPKGSLLLCSRATIGEIKIAGEPMCTNQGFKSLICHTDVCNEFLYYKLLTMKREMIGRSFGSTFLEISTRNVSALEIYTPKKLEQAAIASVLSDMDAELAALEARRDKTRDIKQGMMQELLTGKTRLI